MKNRVSFYIFFFYFCFICVGFCVDCRGSGLDDLFSYSTTTTWREFALTSTALQLKDKKWAWIGLITLKCKDSMQLEKITLQWNGKPLSRLGAALYQKKETINHLIPVQENLVCDGEWDQVDQQLIFAIHKKIVSTHHYYLLLNFPATLESTIKHGHFSVPDSDALIITKL